MLIHLATTLICTDDECAICARRAKAMGVIICSVQIEADEL
jgi:hypothetical protein